mmetsp:Transcript_133661/g.415699  ORF Transcript_133661/g.415699 Transcript_133661/m.415699 type:complete len:223 (-) Transcript_133661:2-670(-)
MGGILQRASSVCRSLHNGDAVARARQPTRARTHALMLACMQAGLRTTAARVTFASSSGPCAGGWPATAPVTGGGPLAGCWRRIHGKAEGARVRPGLLGTCTWIAALEQEEEDHDEGHVELHEYPAVVPATLVVEAEGLDRIFHEHGALALVGAHGATCEREEEGGQEAQPTQHPIAPRHIFLKPWVQHHVRRDDHRGQDRQHSRSNVTMPCHCQQQRKAVPP